jgi:outer membrane biosynthesis protein TonB
MMGLSKPSTEGDTSVVDSGEARATAMSGASPGLMESHLLFAPEPQYPEAARIAHIQGRVVVEALVGRDGSVVRAHAISGQQALRGPAEKAVSGRRYRPYVVNDIPMAMRTLVTVNFPPR